MSFSRRECATIKEVGKRPGIAKTGRGKRPGCHQPGGKRPGGHVQKGNVLHPTVSLRRNY